MGAGCGFLGVYHIGVSACLKKFAEQDRSSSAGAMCAVALVCDIPLEDITRKVLMLASQSRKLILGPFNPSFNIHQITKDTLEELLPENVAQRVSGKLFISMTKASNKSNIIIWEFYDKYDSLCVQHHLFLECQDLFLPSSENILPLMDYTVTTFLIFEDSPSQYLHCWGCFHWPKW